MLNAHRVLTETVSHGVTVYSATARTKPIIVLPGCSYDDPACTAMHDAPTSRPSEPSSTSDRLTAGSETRSLLHKIFHASPTPIAITRLSDGAHIDVNEEWASFFGYPVDEALNRNSLDLGIWADEGDRAEYYRLLDVHGSVHEFEMDVRTREGDIRTVVTSSQLIDVKKERCVLTVMSDITEHKRTRSALEESERRFRMMADSAPVLIWLTDETGECIYFNRPWLEFTGRSIDEELRSGWAENVHPNDLADCLNTYQEALEKREQFTIEYRMRRHDGVYRWMLDRGLPRYRSDDSFAGFIGSAIEINEQKETEQKLLEAKEYAEATAMLKSTFLMNMTHEIRTPLTVILGFTSILRQGVRPEYHRFINLIERSGRRLLLMLDSMLDLAQLEAGTLEVDRQSHSVTEIVESVVLTLAPIAEEKGLAVNLTLPSERCYASIDHGVLSRVLNNLIDNAMKFTDKGSIDVSVSCAHERIAVVIRDTGIGIESEFINHVFDPFTQESSGLDRTHQGSGIGLSVSKRLLQLMGGSISLDSAKGRGSVFTIILPPARQR